MSNDKTQLPLHRTESLNEFLLNVKKHCGDWEPSRLIETYRAYPFDVIRKECLTALRRPQRRVDAEVLKSLILEVKSVAEKWSDYSLADDLVVFLEVLLFKARISDDDVAQKADIEFAIHISYQIRWRSTAIKKVILSRFLQKPELYEGALPHQNLLSDELYAAFSGVMSGPEFLRRCVYSQEEWARALRALKVIAKVRDSYFVAHLDNIARGYDDGLVYPEKSDLPFEKESHAIIVHSLLDHLDPAPAAMPAAIPA